MSATRFRNLLRSMVPRWLSEGEGGQVLFSLGFLMDGAIERLRQGVHARFPADAPADALALLGRDRRIRRGLGETDSAYRVRLVQWLDDWRTVGNPYALMRQLRAYINQPLVLRTVDMRGNWYTLNADGARDVALAQGNWNWDSADPSRWSRFWVILYPPSTLWTRGPNIGDADLWGGAIGTAGYTIGSTARPEEVAGVRAIVHEWKPAGTRCVKIILAFNPEDFAPDGSGAQPDGTWNLSPNREVNAAYWPG